MYVSFYLPLKFLKWAIILTTCPRSWIPLNLNCLFVKTSFDFVLKFYNSRSKFWNWYQYLRSLHFGFFKSQLSSYFEGMYLIFRKIFFSLKFTVPSRIHTFELAISVLCKVYKIDCILFLTVWWVFYWLSRKSPRSYRIHIHSIFFSGGRKQNIVTFLDGGCNICTFTWVFSSSLVQSAQVWTRHVVCMHASTN